MKKKIIIIIGIIMLLIGLGIFAIFNFSTERGENVENITEIQPEEEISDEQMRETSIKLYYTDKISGVLVPEIRLVDAKDLVENPYLFVIKELMKGPQNESLESPIPEKTKVNSIQLKKNTICIDISEDFLKSSGTDSIYSIVNTLTEFNEVEEVKFLINGESKEGLKEIFVRKEN